MTTKQKDVHITPFVKKMMLVSGGGYFLDGFILVIIGLALIQLEKVLNLNAYWVGLIGAGALGGVFLGSSFLGYLTDKFGRKQLFVIDMIFVFVLSLLQMLVDSPYQLAILRFLLGVGIGADYSIGTPLLAEYAPSSHRGAILGFLQVMWFVGAWAASLVGYLLIPSEEGWKYMLGSAAIPALFLTIGRWNVPESPFWLASRGYMDKALHSLRIAYGDDVKLEDLELDKELEEKNVKSASFFSILKPAYLKRLIFCGGFWVCAVLPLFAIYTFGPKILEAFDLASGRQAILGDMMLNGIFLVGCILGCILIEKFGRRPLIIASYAVMTIGMILLSFSSDSSSLILVMCGFSIYALASGIPNDMVCIYPNELFPTSIRAMGMGISTAISRIGSFAGTFLLPYFLANHGIKTTMWTMTGVTIIGLILCVFLAPETKDLSLEDASKISDK